MDLVLLNARVLDFDTAAEHRLDLAVESGKIKAIEPAGRQSFSARRTIDAADCFIFSGFVDYHTHLFVHGSTFGMDADLLPSAGVTCAVDMGSAGWVNYPAMHRCDLAGKKLLLKSYLNISPIGQPGKGLNEPLSPAVISREEIERRIDEYAGEIVGLKVRISRGIVGALGLDPLRCAVELGDQLDLPVCVHTTDPPVSAGEVAAVLRPGDIYSHTYHGKGNTILGADGHVQPGIVEAQRRGVLLEVGNGKMNFDFPVAQAALADGVYPDIISSDSTPATFHKAEAMWDLPFVVSKFVGMGMPLAAALRAVTETPARVLGLEHRIGRLAVGLEANFTLCRWDDSMTTFRDSADHTMSAARGLVPVQTLYAGRTIWQA